MLLVRMSPGRGSRGFGGPQYATFRQKARTAARLGARAVLLVNDLAGLKGKPDELLKFDAAGPGGIRIPFLMITRDFAERLLAASGLPGLEELEKSYREEKPPAGRALEGWTADTSVEIEPTTIKTKNVVGVLEGAGPQADETVVVGAHYDHLGRGGAGSLAPGSEEIHNGADDNASGTSLVIELARRLGRRLDAPAPPHRLRRLLGRGAGPPGLGPLRRRAPPYKLADTVLMMNFDMVGRLGEKDGLSGLRHELGRRARPPARRPRA